MVVFFTVICSGSLIANERRGADPVIIKTDGREIKGELIAVKPSSLLLLDSKTGGDVSVEIRDLKVIKIVKKSKALLGAGLGLAAGLVAGLIIGGAEETTEQSTAQNIGFYSAVIGGPAILLGTLLGVALGVDKQIQIESKSPEEIEAVMEKLRKQARITDFQ